MEKRQSAQAIPRLHTIHQGTVKSIQAYGAFIGIEGYKDALLHISRIACSRIEKVEDVLDKNDKVFVKITEVDEDSGKVGCDMRFVGQKKGEDKDPNNVLLAQQDRGKKGSGKGTGKPDNIQLEAVLNTTCTKCGGHGHYAKECWNASGNKYALLDENDEKKVEQPRSRGPVTRGLDAVQPAWKTKLDSEKDSKRAKKEAKKEAKKKKKKKKDKKVKKKLKKKKDAKTKKKKKKKDSSSSSSSSSSGSVSDASL